MEMPVLRPIPIPTKDVGFFNRAWRWFSSVRKWEVMEDYRYMHKGTLLLIPKGFVFNGASVPKLFWSVLSPTGLLLIQSMFHDYAYKFDHLLQKKDGVVSKFMPKAGKATWDLLFRVIGQDVNGVNVANYIAWLAVKFFGFWAWSNKRDRDHGPPGAGMEASDKLPPIEERGMSVNGHVRGE